MALGWTGLQWPTSPPSKVRGLRVTAARRWPDRPSFVTDPSAKGAVMARDMAVRFDVALSGQHHLFGDAHIPSCNGNGIRTLSIPRPS